MKLSLLVGVLLGFAVLFCCAQARTIPINAPVVSNATTTTTTASADEALHTPVAANDAANQHEPLQVFAFVTFVAKRTERLGAGILGRSLRRTNTPHDMLALIAPVLSDDEGLKVELQESGWKVVELGEVANPFGEMCGSKDGCFDYSMLKMWNLPYTKAVFIASDMKVQHNIDELFNTTGAFSATTDCQHNNIANNSNDSATRNEPPLDSHVFVFTPSHSTFEALFDHLSHFDPTRPSSHPTVPYLSPAHAISSFFTPNHAVLARQYNCAESCTMSALSLLDTSTLCKVVFSANSCLEPTK